MAPKRYQSNNQSLVGVTVKSGAVVTTATVVSSIYVFFILGEQHLLAMLETPIRMMHDINTIRLVTLSKTLEATSKEDREKILKDAYDNLYMDGKSIILFAGDFIEAHTNGIKRMLGVNTFKSIITRIEKMTAKSRDRIYKEAIKFFDTLKNNMDIDEIDGKEDVEFNALYDELSELIRQPKGYVNYTKYSKKIQEFIKYKAKKIEELNKKMGDYAENGGDKDKLLTDLNDTIDTTVDDVEMADELKKTSNNIIIQNDNLHQAQLDVMDTTNDKVEKTPKEKKQIKKLKKEITENKATYETLFKQKKEVDAKLKETEGDLEKIKKEHKLATDKLKKKIEDTESKHKKTNELLEKANTRKEELTNELEQKTTNNDALTSKIAALDKKIIDLEAKVATLETDHDNLADELDMANSDYLIAKEKNEEALQDYMNLQEEKEKIEEKLKTLENKATEHETQIQKHINKEKLKTGITKQLKNELENLQQQHNKLTEELKEFQDWKIKNKNEPIKKFIEKKRKMMDDFKLEAPNKKFKKRPKQPKQLFSGIAEQRSLDHYGNNQFETVKQDFSKYTKTNEKEFGKLLKQELENIAMDEKI